MFREWPFGERLPGSSKRAFMRSRKTPHQKSVYDTALVRESSEETNKDANTEKVFPSEPIELDAESSEFFKLLQEKRPKAEVEAWLQQHSK